MEKLAASLADAQVDLNPHQLEAALFAFRSPLSKGAILADEVGLGKTIEAGILLPSDGLNASGRFSSLSPQVCGNSGIRSFRASSSYLRVSTLISIAVCFTNTTSLPRAMKWS